MTPQTLFMWSLLLALATWRATRFFLNDSLLDEWRATWQRFLVNKPESLIRRKLLELTTCPWCVSVWVAAAGVAFWRWQEATELGWFNTALVWLATCAMAMAAYRTWDEN